MSKEITLAKSKKVTIREAEIKELSKVTLLRIVDNMSQKAVRAFIQELPNPVTLWEGKEYDAIGDWTQKQAEARLAQVINVLK